MDQLTLVTVQFCFNVVRFKYNIRTVICMLDSAEEPHPNSLSENQGGSAPLVFRVGGAVAPQAPLVLTALIYPTHVIFNS